MKLAYWYLAVSVLLCPAAIAQPVTPPLEDRLVSCQKCHVGKLALTGRPAEQTMMALQQIREGKKPHPPGLKTFAQEELAGLVEIMTRVPAP